MANSERAAGTVIEHTEERVLGEGLYRETGLLRATPHFDFGKSLQFLGEFSPMGGEQDA